MKIPIGAWDGRILSVVLKFASDLDQRLIENMLRMRGLGDAVDAARREAFPNPVDLHEVGQHSVCGGRGCVECHWTGVGRREDGRPFRAPPPETNPVHVYDSDPQPPEAARYGWVDPTATDDPFAAAPALPPPRGLEEARARLADMAEDFDALGILLTAGGRHATKLAIELRRLLRQPPRPPPPQPRR
jgi:hypothetical protein